MTDPAPKPRLRPVIRVFVSSTFSDLVAELNALQEQVFPWLREFCLKRGARFQAIDLRFRIREGYARQGGIAREQADNDQVLGGIWKRANRFLRNNND